MIMKEFGKIGMTRRQFVKGTALTIGGGLIAGCSPRVSSETNAPADGQSGMKYSWETAPDPIPASQIKQTLETEVLVIGFGASGINAALRAAELGAKVTVLQKNKSWFCPGNFVGGFGSRQQREANYLPDLDEIAHTFQLINGNKTEPALLKLWLNNGGKVIDWMEKYGDAAGVDLVWTGADKEYLEDDDFLGREYATNHMWFYPQVADVLVQEIVKKGVDIHYETPAVQLVRAEGGRVTGAVAKAADGTYLQVNASKGVILAAGDYCSNPEMIDKYCPMVKGFKPVYGGDNTGDGQLMAMWVGGKVQRWQHAPMVHFGPEDVEKPNGGFQATPWLWVNGRGERFCDEDMPFNQACWATQRQPDNFHWSVFDSTFNDQWPELGGLQRWTRGVIGKFTIKNIPFNKADGQKYIEENWQNTVDGGGVFKADTIEALAGMMNVPVDTLVATVNRYNELVDKGVDEDYGKRSRYLIHTGIKQAPFYAAPHKASLLTVPGGGVMVNTNLQVLDENDTVIPGLYACGNDAGGFFGQDYPLMFSGCSMGRAVTWGYLAGENIVNEAA